MRLHLLLCWFGIHFWRQLAPGLHVCGSCDARRRWVSLLHMPGPIVGYWQRITPEVPRRFVSVESGERS